MMKIDTRLWMGTYYRTAVILYNRYRHYIK